MTKEEITLEFELRPLEPATVFKMRELSRKDIEHSFDRLAAAKGNLGVLHAEQDGLFERSAILSSGKVYEVIRLGYFAYCPCGDFEFKGGCKHIGLVLPRVCVHCMARRVNRPGAKCDECYYLTEGFLRRPAVSVPTSRINL